jgi:uncharacterized delta-60 repeat protein
VQRYNGPGNDFDYASAIAVDGAGNVYVTGYSVGSGTDFDYVTIKYNSTGVQQWVARYDGPGNDNDEANAIAVDSSGNVYVTGLSYGSGTSADYVTIKYNSSGQEQWVQRYNGPGNFWDWAYAIAVDGSGNVYVTGFSYGLGTDDDYATIKYDSSGQEQWVQRYNGPGNYYDDAYAIAVDSSGNVYVTGFSYGSGTYSDYATIKYDSAGQEQWIQRYDGLANYDDRAYAIAVDGSGNVYVTGKSYGSGTNYDYATIKYVQTQGIEEVKSKMENVKTIEVFPNPARSYFAIRCSQTADRAEIKIFDIAGNIVKSEELRTKNCRISLDGIKNGVYFVTVGNEMVKEKLVIAK